MLQGKHSSQEPELLTSLHIMTPQFKTNTDKYCKAIIQLLYLNETLTK